MLGLRSVCSANWLANHRSFSSSSKYIRVEEHEDTGLAVMSLRKAPVNSIDARFARDIASTVLELEAHPRVRGVLVRSEWHGKCFSAGLDVAGLYKRSDDEVGELWRQVVKMSRALFAFAKPLVASVNGAAIGGGCALALVSDYRLALPHAAMGFNEVQLGVALELIVMLQQHACSARNFNRDALLTGQLCSAQDALKHGMVDELSPVDEITRASMARLRQLAQIPPLAYSLTKQLTRRKILEKLEDCERDVDYFVATVQSEQVQHIIENKLKLLKSKQQ